jgi:hypothetical protein
MDSQAGGGGGTDNYTHGESVYYNLNGPVAFRNPRYMFWNGAGGPDEVSGNNPIDVEAGMNFQAGGPAFQLTFNGGKDTRVTLAPGARIWSDPVPVIVPAGAEWAIRTGVYVATAGQTWPTGQRNYASKDNGVASTVQTSRVTETTTGISIPAGGKGNLPSFTHFAMTAEYDEPEIAVLILGDSHGTGNTGNNGNGSGDRGTLSYGLAEVSSGRVPYARLARDGAYGSSFGNPWSVNTKFRFEQIDSATHVICFLGTNDIGSRTLAQMQALYLALWAKCRGGGRSVIQVLNPPRTVSMSDLTPYATQWAVGGVRDQVNAWIKTQVGVAGGIDDFLDFNGVWESASAPGTWVTTYSSDGTHANEAGMQAAKGIVSAKGAAWRAKHLGLD